MIEFCNSLGYPIPELGCSDGTEVRLVFGLQHEDRLTDI